MFDEFLKILSKGLGWGLAFLITFLVLCFLIEFVLSSDIFDRIQAYLWKYIIN